MMARLLNLPLVVRAMIFEPLVVFPTRYIEPISRMEEYRRRFPSSSSSSPIFFLAIISDFEASEPAEVLLLSPEGIPNHLPGDKCAVLDIKYICLHLATCSAEHN